MENNKLIIEKLQLVIKYKVHLKKTGHGDKGTTHSINAINRAISAIKLLDVDITSKSMALKVSGIGKGIADRIDKILKGEMLEEEEKLLELFPEIQEEEILNTQIKDLTRVHGIGESYAKKFVEKFGIKSVEQLKDAWRKGIIRETKNELTHAMVMGLKYFDEIEKRIPRSEIDKVNEYISEIISVIDENLIYEIVGSYRRGCPDSGDIDILIAHKNLKTKKDVNEEKIMLEFDINVDGVSGKEKNVKFSGSYFRVIINILKTSGFIVNDFDEGDTKFMGMCTIDGINLRRLDIRFLPMNSWGSALMHTTGSKNFNIEIRKVCNSMGYTLSEDGLFKFKNKVKGECVPLESEEEIFEFLGLEYLSPTERNF